MTNKIRYVWTAEDQRIAGGNTDQSVQGPYVTPYGIRAGVIPKAATFSAGTEYGIDMDLSLSGEPWRARRFHEEKPAAEGVSYFKWQQLTIPAGVNTLGELCKYLREKDPGQYPETIYGEKKVKATKAADNPAQMLFDYRKNSKYRFAVVKSGFDWRTYANDPGSIPIRKDGVALEHVLQKVTPVPRAAAAPGVQRKTIDFSTLAVDHYMQQLNECITRIHTLLSISDRVLRERMQVVYRLHALRAIAEASTSNPDVDFSSDGPKVVKLVDSILPRVQKVLIEQPIAHPANSSEQKLGEFFSARKEFTLDVVADLQAEKEKLQGLLLTGNEHSAMLKKFFQDNHATFFVPARKVVSVVDQLLATMADAHVALGECADYGHDDTLFALLDRMKERHAEKPEDIEGDSPTDVALSFVGKGVSLTMTAVGNLAGPPSLSIAILQVAGSIRFARVVKEAHGTLALGPGKARLLAFEELFNRFIKHISDPKLKKDIGPGLREFDQQKLLKLRNEVGEDLTGSAQVTVPWKRAMAILGLISAILSLRDALDSFENRSAGMKVLDFASNANSIGSVYIGTLETFVTAVGKLGAYKDFLTKWGNRIGLIGAITGLISGIVGLCEAADKADTYGMVSNILGAGGSFGMGACVFMTWVVGTSPVPIAAALALACLLASGAVSVVEMVEAMDNSSTKSQKLCRELLASVRKSILGRFAEWADSQLLFGMDDLEKLLTEGFIPNAKNDFLIVGKLAKAGLSRSMIQEVVNTTSLATTPLGPSPFHGLP